MLPSIIFTHHGLATATLVLTLLTTITGITLLGTRYGLPPHHRGLTVLRWSHITLGVFMAVYVLATYFVVPL